MTYSRETTAISEITGQPIHTWSEDWKHECEARAVMAMSKAERHAFFHGTPAVGDERPERGVIAMRGEKGAAIVQQWIDKLQSARNAKR